MVTKLVYPKLSYEIMNVLFGVHNELGPGLLEKHYQRGIEAEFQERKICFEKEKLVRLQYKGKSVGRFFVDFVVSNKVVLEVKATRLFGQASFKQAYSYLRQLDLPLAIIVNFHSKKLRYKRVVNPEFEYKGLVE